MAEKGSDVLIDFCCNVCEEGNLTKEAMFYCQQCNKSLCNDCIGLHNQFYKMHVANGRSEMEKWPVKKNFFEELKFCQQHKDQPIAMFCEDHSKLCCPMCLFHEHRHCVKLVLIEEKSQAVNEMGDFHTLPAIIAEIQKKLETAKDDTQKFRNELKDSYDKAYKEINLLRQKINDILDELERKTILSLDNLLQTLTQSIQSDADTCSKTTDGLEKICNTINDIENIPNDLSFIAYHKTLEIVSHAQNLFKELTGNRRPLVIFNKNPSIDTTLSELSSLGSIEYVEKNPKKDNTMIIECKSKNLHNVRLTSDKSKCELRGIIELPGGEILIADYENKNIKLLDKTYTVVSHLGLPDSPYDICSIGPNEVAVTVGQWGKTFTVQFLKVKNRRIKKGIALNFKHNCLGIAYYNKSLFITSYTALYQYTLDGQLLKKIYEDTSGSATVYKCAVSADGSRLYVTNFSNNKLLTLSMDGAVLSSLEDPALRHPRGVHVSETGQLLVCEDGSHSVVQVDGERGVVTLISVKDHLNFPECVYYSARTDRLIVVQENDSIMIINSK